MSPPSPPDELDVAPLDELEVVPPEDELDVVPLDEDELDEAPPDELELEQQLPSAPLELAEARPDELDVPVSEQHPSTALGASELPESVPPERGDEVPHARTAKKKDVASVVLANTASCAFVFMIQNLPCAEIVPVGASSPKKYDCLACAVCYRAIAANAFAEEFPGAAAGLDLCPTEAPEERAGWPPLPGDHRVVRYAAPVAVCTLNDEHLVGALADAAPERLAIVGTSTPRTSASSA
jgi:hypothetical protein